MSFNLATMLRESAMHHPDKPCARFAGETVTYAQLDERSGRIAIGLRSAGLRFGDKVAVQLPNLPEFLYAYFGILKAGLVAVPFNPQLKAAEIEHQLVDAEVRAFITYGPCGEEARKAAAAASVQRLYTVDGSLPHARPFAALYGTGPSDVAARRADDTAVIIYTSGTTGRPKGAELTHFQLFMNCTVAGEQFGIHADDVTLAALPFFHIYGLSSIVNATVRFGVTMSVVPRFDVALALDAMAAHRVSVFVGVPTMFHALLAADVAGRDLSRLRTASSGGSSMPAQLLDRFEEKFGVVILEGYGMSETGSSALLNPSVADRKLMSVGKPIWGVEVRVVDGEGRVLPPGPDSIGEILLRGHNVMKGYYRNPAATAEAIRDGWLHTGDLGYADEDGFIYIVDRKKDLIIRGGYNVYPREVEEILYAHPAVAEAAVIGRPDERVGEEVVAVVSLWPGTAATGDAIIAHCRERLAPYKCPREVRILEELPKSPTGKVLKRELRKY